MEAQNERAGGQAGSVRNTNQRQAEAYTVAGDKRKRPGKLRVIEAEADALERGAEILAEATFTNCGPVVEQLGRALELLLRKEAARVRHRLLHGKGVAELFADEMPA